MLSNKEGWKTFKKAIVGFMNEGDTAVDNALSILENQMYLMRIRYRDTKWVGSVWAYTDDPGNFVGLEELLEDIEEKGYKPVLPSWFKEIKPTSRKPRSRKPTSRNQGLNNTNTNTNNTNGEDDDDTREETLFGRLVRLSDFEEFMTLYPNKGDRGKARAAWNTLCGKKNRPTIQTVREAIADQKKSERWKNKKYIPLPATWINQNRWEDDPKLMTGSRSNNPSRHKATKKTKARRTAKI